MKSFTDMTKDFDFRWFYVEFLTPTEEVDDIKPEFYGTIKCVLL